MRRLILSAVLLTTLAPAADAAGRCRRCRPRACPAAVVRQPAPAFRPAAVAPAPPVFAGPLATAARGCVNGVCPK